ncbi:MAG: efflux RND transporter permease subunit [Pseudomonadota bacterium]
MWLADVSIKRPVFATMMVLFLVVMGVVSYPRIGVDLFPRVEFPIVNITTVQKGANPEIVDIEVTDKIEETVNTINGVKSIMSRSMAGVSVVTVEFFLERDVGLAVQDVREKISAIRSKLPSDIDEPVIEKVDPDAVEVLWIALSGKRSIRELSTYANEVLKEQLQRINGVGAIRLSGLRLRQIRIWLDPEKMRAYQLTAKDVLAALRREHVELPGGRIESLTKEYAIKIKGQFPQIQDFNDLIVGFHNGAPIRLRDVGSAEDGVQEQRSIARFNGLPSVGLGIQKQSGTNTVQVIGRIKEELRRLKQTLPPGMDLDISFDQSGFIEASINEVKHHLIYGAIFSTLVVLLFLRNFRVTLISAVAIPTSIISTFAIMNAFGFTFNNMTMLGLALSIGILIDDAIIVIENICRHMEGGMSPKEAASFATSEIGLAVMATTLAIVAIFLPVAFMKGIVGRFFFQFAMTVVFAVIVSLFVSFTLTPMLASRYLKSRESKVQRRGSSTADNRESFFPRLFSGLERGYQRIEAAYSRLLKLALNHRKAVLGMAGVIFIASMGLVAFIGKEFLPKEDQGQFVVRLVAPVDYSVDAVDALFKTAEERVKSIPEVKNIFYSQGVDAGEINKAEMFVGLRPKSERSRKQDELMVEVRKKLSDIPGIKAAAENLSMIGGGQRHVPIQYSIRGLDLRSLEGYTRSISQEFSRLPGVVDMDTSIEAGKPELRVYIDRDKAADLGVDVASAAEAINFLIGGEVDVAKFKDEARGRQYDIRARLYPQGRTNPGDIGKLFVRAGDGRMVELSSIIRIEEAGGPSSINRVDRQRAIMLFANLEEKPLGQAMQELDAISGKVLPPDYSGKHKGMAEVMAESFGYLIFALVLGIFVAYMVLASQFDSFIHPFTILLSMPLSFIGAFGALLLTGKTINIFSLIGIILLMGLVKKNAILLVDYTNTLRAKGMERRAALLEAGPVRLRPILMTTLAMVLGMFPIALGLGEGSETRSPMAITTIGGLLTSLFLTLIVVPVAYELFDDLQAKFRFATKTQRHKEENF